MLTLIADRDFRVPSGCSIMGIMNLKGEKFTGRPIMEGIANMRERANGLGGGFAAYGIYPEYEDCYAFHLLYEESAARDEAEAILGLSSYLIHKEPIPTRRTSAIRTSPDLWRYFVHPRVPQDFAGTEEDFVIEIVMRINREVSGAFVFSSGKNMGIFKGVGFPEDLGEFYGLEEYSGYLWTAHGRFPTNSVGWWGGAHPFGLLDWSVVHNGEISSYGINKRFLENYGYYCCLSTDTEVITYLVDLLVRKFGFSYELMARIFAPPFWDVIEHLPEKERKLTEALRFMYGGALLNGPFAIIAASGTSMVGLNDRAKLRPLVAARHGDTVYLASEEAAIREICPQPDRVWTPRAGQPVIARLEENHMYAPLLTSQAVRQEALYDRAPDRS